ncbi:RHS repeat-associated core domain-containing protein [Glaciimonas sp. Gout2]|uniref:RHS repeat-associated core domain-containing protein n=1 Tax=unclassified Glaciimonas TaxID=2644401 RepID=UPI002B228DE6|nr:MULTISPECIES: RHS repeat-associated core domain-containing protein [unclassified Glaciimonas]MEB0011496.1 RHS repeat-associated core domain-containing protein [Glaciimonas sp. Cout2]MEB0081500.1 RHS repeat-associated core domain-containing protein [Glaciimonas sp. Gout2]
MGQSVQLDEDHLRKQVGRQFAVLFRSLLSRIFKVLTPSRYRGQKFLTGAVLMTLAGLSGTVTSAQATPSTTSYAYDKMGNVTTITDPLGNVTTYQYDSLNRPIQQRLPAPMAGGVGPTINVRYDGQDQPRSVTDPRSLVTTYDVDGFGNQTAITSPDTGTTLKTYDEAGNMETSTDARGKTTTYTYDVLNRVSHIADASGTVAQFDYDGVRTGNIRSDIGSLTRMRDPSGFTTYHHDGFGQLRQREQTIGSGSDAQQFSLAYTYAVGGNERGLTGILTYPSGNRIRYEYDATTWLIGLTLLPVNAPGSGIPLLTHIDYQPFGPVNGWTWGNSTTAAPNIAVRTFDMAGRITGYPLGNIAQNGTQRQLAYDAASRIIGMTHTGGVTNKIIPNSLDQRFSYDNLGRVISVTASTAEGDHVQHYHYDQSGNRTQTVFDNHDYANTIAANSNRLTATTGPAPARVNIYDAAGHVLSDGTRSYLYNNTGRMISATNAGNTVTYTYNGKGQRTIKQGPETVVATGLNSYIYDKAGHLIGEYDAHHQVIQETVFLGDIPVTVMRQRSGNDGKSTVTELFYIYADHANTPRVITDARDNQIVWRWDHADPFGILPPHENPSGLGNFTYNPRFPGQLYDRETDHFYNYYRDYDPQLGRYLQSDPIGLAGGINTYGYVGGNPVSYSDPFGLNPATAIGAGIGTAIFPGPGTVVGAVVGTGVGVGLGYWVNSVLQQNKLPPGAIDAIPGSKEWGRRNGVDNAVDIFHEIKKGNRRKPGSKAVDNCAVNPNTGEVFDGNGEHIGDLGDGH